jgi:hypothetical protein
MPKICYYAPLNTLYGPSKFGTCTMHNSLLGNYSIICKLCTSIAPQCHVLACQNHHIIGHITACGVAIIMLNSWHQNLSPGQPPYLQTSHINSTTTRCVGMLKLCHHTRLNILYGSSKFGTCMINGLPPVAFFTRKFRTSIAPRRLMLACWNFAGMLILIPSMVCPNLELAWWTVHPPAEFISHPQTLYINCAMTLHAGMLKLCWYAHPNTLYGLSQFGTCVINCSPAAEFIFHSQILNINSTTMPCVGMPKLSYYWSRHCTWHWCHGIGVIILILDTKTCHWGNLHIYKLRTSIPPQPDVLACWNFATMLI